MTTNAHSADLQPASAIAIQIRPMRPEEEPFVRQSLPFFMRLFSKIPSHVLVADRGGELVGATVPKIFPLPRGRKGGLLLWTFTVPEARDRGLGLRLAYAGNDYLKAAGCDQIFTCIQGYNTASSRLAPGRGFSIMPPGDQFGKYGLRTLGVWAQISHFGDIGGFIWTWPSAASPRPTLQWWGSMLANVLVALLALTRRHWLEPVEPAAFLLLPPMVLAMLAARHGAMRWSARRQDVDVEYRAWESGFPLSTLVALIAGRLLPIPGGIYPQGNNWRYRNLLPKLARIAMAGVVPAIVLAGAAGVALRTGALPSTAALAVESLQSVARPLIVFDLLLPFYPFSSFNGRRIWEWNRKVWIVLAAAGVAAICL